MTAISGVTVHQPITQCTGFNPKLGVMFFLFFPETY